MDGMDKIIDNSGRVLKRKLILGGSITLFIAVIIYLLMSNKGSKLNISIDKIMVEPVTYNLFQDYIAVIGTVGPIQTVYLDATEGGRIEEIYLREGAKVNKGDDIMRLSNDGLLLEISNYEAEVSRAINDLKSMRFNLENQLISNRTQLVDYYYDILKLERDYHKNIILVKDKYISHKSGIFSKQIHSYDYSGPYAGFIGTLNFARDIAYGMTTPAWGLVTPPWKTEPMLEGSVINK